MKLIDKYLLRTFVMPLAYCLLAFILIYIIFDLFDNMSDFMEAKTTFPLIFKYYIYLIPSVIIYIVPVSLLLAALYSLSSLTRNNELTAMRASGISILRLMAPFIVVGLLASVLVTIIDEAVGPKSAYWTYKFLRSEKHKNDISVYVAEMLGLVNEKDNRDWMIGQFDTRTIEMRNVIVTQKYPDGTSQKIQARLGHWLDGRWWFREVIIQAYDKNGNPRGRVQFEPRKEMVDFNETPAEFLSEIKDPLENPEYVSVQEILQFMNTHELSDSGMARLKVNLHNRLAMPWTCLIVTLLGIPFGAHTGRKGAFLGITSSIALFFVFYSMMNVGLMLGKKQIIEPWVAGWMPNIIFFCLGCILVYRMR